MALKTHHRVPLVLALALTACGGETTIGTSEDPLLLEVDHYDGVCEGNGSWYCPRVREAGTDQSWRELPCEIDDFDQKFGHRYLIEAETFSIEPVLDGCGTVGHRLVDVIEETPVEAGTRFNHEARGYELYVDDAGGISFVSRTLVCADTTVCDGLASAVTEDSSGRFNLVFEHTTPGEEPRLVRFDVVP